MFEDNKNALLGLHDQICLFLSNLSGDLPAYYRYVIVFSEFLLYQINDTDTAIQSAMTNPLF